MKLISIAGARPNFMKLSSISNAVEEYNLGNSKTSFFEKIEHTIVHTGQHYDTQMSHQFFDELKIPKPEINLEVGSGSHAVQTAEIMKRFEPILLEKSPDILLVVGDVNSTIACTLVASKVNYPSDHILNKPLLAHVEAGLRSYDRGMPEEINRVLTDTISDLLFVTEESAITNLKREGVDHDKIHFVGNVMIDTLYKYLELAKKSGIKKELGLDGTYSLVTLHRPSNVDRLETLKPLIDCLDLAAERLKLVFPMHPRTKTALSRYNLLSTLENNKNIILSEPLGYIDFMSLLMDAALVLTDSGGIQEETTALNVPCITLRDNTERPVTVTEGSNYLIGMKINDIIPTVELIMSGKGKVSKLPEFWDGHAGERIIEQLMKTWQGKIVSRHK